MEKSKRLLSLDVLRGFDMFFIMGGSALFIALYKWLPCGFTEVLANQMKHVEWDGFAFFDMIFPLFLFIAGISFPYSYAKKLEKGLSKKRIHLDILWRALILIALGVVYNGFFKLDFANLRIASVLGRIGVAWAVAAVLFVNTSRRTRITTAVAVLLGYWALLALCPAPDVTGYGPFTQEGSLVGYVDRILLPGKLLYGNFDPEGILSTVPAIVTAMLGMFAGEVVREIGTKNGNKASLILTGIGAGLVIIGLVWGLAFPINKKLWSSSYVCFVGGLSYLLFALFYFLIDVLEWRKGTLFFSVIGLNSITIYMAQRIINFRYTAEFFGGGLAGLLSPAAGAVLMQVFYITVCWLFLYFLYRKKIFLKV